LNLSYPASLPSPAPSIRLSPPLPPSLAVDQVAAVRPATRTLEMYLEISLKRCALARRFADSYVKYSGDYWLCVRIIRFPAKIADLLLEFFTTGPTYRDVRSADWTPSFRSAVCHRLRDAACRMPKRSVRARTQRRRRSARSHRGGIALVRKLFHRSAARNEARQRDRVDRNCATDSEDGSAWKSCAVATRARAIMLETSG